MFKNIQQWWLELVRKANAKGIPVPLLRDPASGLGSVSLTLVFISFNIWLISVIGKLAGILGGLNTADCLNMFMVTAGLYWGRKFQSDGTSKSLTDKVE